MEGKKFSHNLLLLSWVVTLVSLYHGVISRSEFYVFYKKLGDQIAHEQKLNK